MTPRPQPISDRIAAWKQAYDAVLAEVRMAEPRAFFEDEPGMTIRPNAVTPQMVELAARTAATLAIGATARERGE